MISLTNLLSTLCYAPILRLSPSAWTRPRFSFIFRPAAFSNLTRPERGIWELLGQGLNAEQIVQHLVSEFEVEDSQAAEELKTLLSQLRDQGLVAA